MKQIIIVQFPTLLKLNNHNGFKTTKRKKKSVPCGESTRYTLKCLMIDVDCQKFSSQYDC